MKGDTNSSCYRIYTDLERAGAYTRPILRGVLRYAATAEHWDSHFAAFGDRMARSATPEHYDGRILRYGPVLEEQVRSADPAPVVCVSDRPERFSGPTVVPDNIAVGAMAADYLIELGFRQLAMVGPLGVGVGLHRFHGFRERVRAIDGQVITLADAWQADRGVYRAPRDWLAALPVPCGVFCWNDETARNVILDAGAAGRSVPEDLAVVGVHNDDLLCESVQPNITSIALPLETVGYEAAALLDRLVQGQAAPDEPIRFAPIEVVERGSTRSTADDPDVAQALAIIRSRATRGLSVDQICESLALPISRRTLERRFVQALGRTPHEEIRRIQVQRARELLINTDLPQEEIAHRCGFSSNPFFSNTFKRVTGQRPGAYRNARRRRR